MKNKIFMGVLMAFLISMLYVYSAPYIMYAIVGGAIFTSIIRIVLAFDGHAVNIDVETQHSGRQGKDCPYSIVIHKKRDLFVARSVEVDVVICNNMFGTKLEKRIIIELSENKSVYEIPYYADQCGNISIECTKIRLIDILGLFSSRIALCGKKYFTVYPRVINVQIELSGKTKGAFSNDGQMQNRKGTDPSEMFDIREYVPGDDIRSIHWKLSGKTDTLILRQASAPIHYEVALLPDFGVKNNETDSDYNEINTAIAMTMAIGEELVKCGVSFCLVIPADNTLYTTEIDSSSALQKAFSEWMSIALQKNSGMGLKYFDSQHMEQYFTRLILIHAGRYEDDYRGIDSRIGMMAVNVVSDRDSLYAAMAGQCEIIEVPVSEESTQIYKITC